MEPGTRQTGVLLVGGGVASVRCARTLRRGGFGGTILLAADERTFPYNRPPLSKEVLRDETPEELVLAEQPAWYERRGVEVLIAATVTGLDPEARTAELWDGSRIEYGHCLLATGAAPRTLPVAGGAGVPTLRTLADARRLRTAALAARGEAVTIVGGGLIGVEVASSLVTLGVRPTMLVRGDALWGAAMGDALSSWALDRLAAAGVEVRLGSDVTEVVEGRARTAAGGIQGRIVVAGVGVEPRTGLAEGAGLTVDDGIVTDDEGRTSADGVWAAGDVAHSGPRRIEHWHRARESGERVARAILGLPPDPIRAPWTFTEVAGTSIDVVGDGSGVDDERWARPESVLLRSAAGRVVQVAVMAGAADVATARELVERGASVREASAALLG